MTFVRNEKSETTHVIHEQNNGVKHAKKTR